MKTSLRVAAIAIAGVVVGATGMGILHAQATPHAYIVAEVDVKDTAAYRPYIQQTGPIVTQYGGHYIVRGGKTESFEGPKPAGRIALIEFPSMAALERFEASPEYRKVAEIRHRAATSRIFAVEGVTP
jgi:uncharacterized protein (DUF1330 family)